MKYVTKTKTKDKKTWVLMFVGMVIFKLSTEWGYYALLSVDTITYPVSFNIFKYFNGWLWCVLLFAGIRHNSRKVSVFMLYLTYITQIIPMTCVYALANDSAAFYNLTCFAFLFCEIVCSEIFNKITWKWPKWLTNIMIAGFVAILIYLLGIIVLKNGLPGFTALNIYNVYDLRSSAVFSLNKYDNYLLTWMMAAILPFLLANSINHKKYILSFVLSGIIFILYLYTGHKSYLFSIPLVIICSVWMRREMAYKELFIVASFCFALLVLLSSFSPIFQNGFEEIYSLLGRRTMMVSAVNKFKYYDFFSDNPKMGLAGIFPRWLIPISNPYEGETIGKIIADIYYNKPEMNSNTGFLAEGYMRFGYIGIFVGLGIYAAILRLLDRMQIRAGYGLTVSIFIYPVFTLTDAHLMDSLILGPWMILLIIAILYRTSDIKKYSISANKIKNDRVFERYEKGS